MEDRFVLFTREGCPYCVSAQELLEEKGLKHTVYDFKAGQQDAVLKEIKEKHNWTTVPMIFFLSESGAPKFLGGYTDLVQYFEGADGRVE